MCDYPELCTEFQLRLTLIGFAIVVLHHTLGAERGWLVGAAGRHIAGLIAAADRFVNGRAGIRTFGRRRQLRFVQRRCRTRQQHGGQ